MKQNPLKLKKETVKMDKAYNNSKKLYTGRHNFSRLDEEIREFQDDCKLPKFRMDFSNKI